MSKEEKADFRAWHNARLHELDYPIRMHNHLIQCREQWLASIKEKK